MAKIDTLEVKLHVTTLGIPELEHLLAMLNANVENLPTIVVKAMTALQESTSKCAASAVAEHMKAALRSNDHAKAVE